MRQLFAIPEDQIATPPLAITHALAGGPLVLVDDFLGSGDQILDHWQRTYPTPAGDASLAAAYGSAPFQVFYVCLAATAAGLKRVADTHLPITVCAAHIIGPGYDIRNLRNKNILGWFPTIKPDIADFLADWGSRLLLPSYMLQADYSQYGYRSLGLTIGFQHAPCPDSTLPIFWAHSADPHYVPLIVRPN